VVTRAVSSPSGINYPLGYDISDPARLVGVHRLCKEWGLPVQYSVFLVPPTPASIGVLLADLRGIIDERADDVRVYPEVPRPERGKLKRIR
jgi:CRISPR-associated protein Cas2